MLGILIMLIVLILLMLPFLPVRWPFALSWFNFPEEKRPRNLVYIASTVIIFLLTVILMPYLLELAEWFRQLQFIVWIRSFIPNYAVYSTKIFNAVFVNVLFCSAVLLSHWVCGTLCGLFPKFSFAALKEAIKKAKEKRKAEREKKKAEKNKKDLQQSQQQKDPSVLASELIPSPEEKDFESRVVLQGASDKPGKKVVRKDNGKQAPEQEEEQEEKGFSLIKWLLRIFALFYVKGEDGWYVQPQCKKVAKHLRNFLILVGIAYLAIFALLMIPIFFKVEHYAEAFYNVMTQVVENCYLYPSVSLVLLTEIFWFMNGRLPKEPVDELEEVAARRANGRIVDLDALEQHLVESVGAAYEIKSFYSGDVEEQRKARLPVDTSQDAVLQAVVGFVESQKLVRNDDYLRGIQTLQRGEDALFDAPLYTPVSMYLYPYLNIRISQGERLLVICQDAKSIDGVIENMREGFRLVQRTHQCLWRINDRRNIGLNNETDILVLTPQDFLDDRLFVEAEDFFRRVTIALLPDADRVVMANNYLCVIIAERLQQATQAKKESRFINNNEKNIQYIFLSTRHTLNLARSLTEYFMLEKEVNCVQAEYAYGNVRLYVWRDKGKARPILDNIAQQVKLESMIAEIAAKHHVPKISVFTDVAIFSNQIDPIWLNTYDAFDRPIGFTIVSDDSYNLPGTIYTYARYLGKQASVLHVISKPYMLRDFFYDNAIRSLFERPLMERGIVEHAQSGQTGAVLLLCRLMKGIPVPEFAEKMAKITGTKVAERITYPELRKLVDACLTMAFGREATSAEYGFRRMDLLDNAFTEVPYIQIREEGILDHLIRDTQLARVHIAGSGEIKVLPLFTRMLAQRHLPGQHMVIDHNNYQILDVDFEQGIIYATAAKVVHNVPDQYIQMRNYTFGSSEAFKAACRGYAEGGAFELKSNIRGTRLDVRGRSDLASLTIVQGTGAVEIDSHTVAYYDTRDYNGQLNLESGTVFCINTDVHRKVENALYLRFDGNFAADDQVTMTLAILLQEMMKTMFPDQHFCISVCPILHNPESVYEHEDPLSRSIAQLYPRLTGWDTPADNSVELLIVDDCQGGTGVLDILFQQEAVYISNILDMLCEYLDWLKEHPKGAYLNYGAEETPQLYQLECVRDLLSVFYKGYLREHDLFRDLDAKMGCCKLCEKMLSPDETYIWNNEHSICQECEQELRPDVEQADEILQHICCFIEQRFKEKIGTLTVEFDERVDISGLDLGAGKILLEPNLPLTAVHCQLVIQVVRYWQMKTLLLTGEPEFEGQLLYVLLQYLEHLEQHQHRKRLHSRTLLGKDATSVGYCRIRQELQVEKHNNSFQYMRNRFSGNGTPTPPPEPEPIPEPAPEPQPGPGPAPEPKPGPRPTPTPGTEPKPEPKQPPAYRRRSTRVDPKHLRFYLQEQLTGDERKFYDLLLKGLQERQATIDVSSANVNARHVKRLWYSVLNDHQELHWVDYYQFVHSVDPTTHNVTAVKPTYCCDEQEQKRRQEELEQVVPEYLEGVTDEMGDYEVALQIYFNMARRIDYDSLALDREKTRRGRKHSNGPDDLRNVYGALVQRKTVCHGYAAAYQYLLQRSGVEAMFATGTCRPDGRHGWNIIKLEGDYYHTDVTWGDGSNTDAMRSTDEPNFAYFALNDRDIKVTRSIDRTVKLPACTATACNYFVRNGLYFTAYDHGAIVAKLTELLKEPGRCRVDLRFANATLLEIGVKQLICGGGIVELLRNTGRANYTSHSVYEQLNVLTVFFSPLVKKDNPTKPEEM